jgi:hypothetical protein
MPTDSNGGDGTGGALFNKGSGEGFNDPSDHQANHYNQVLEFYHIPTDKSVAFKAFVTDFSDKYESDWESEDVFGRMDPIKTFKGTKREISISWEVISASIDEAKDNLARATMLFSMLYPVYNTSAGASNSTTPATGNASSGATAMRAAPLFKFKFVNLVQDVSNVGGNAGGAPAKTAGLVGTMEGFSYSPDFDSGFFTPIGEKGVVYPQTIKLEATYTALHTHGLGWNNAGEKRQKNFPYNAGEVSPTTTSTEETATPTGQGETPAQRTDEANQNRLGEVL